MQAIRGLLHQLSIVSRGLGASLACVQEQEQTGVGTWGSSTMGQHIDTSKQWLPAQDT